MKKTLVMALALLVGGMLATSSLRAQSHSDKEFLAKDSQGNVAEVELAKLALTKSSNPDVKTFAERMIRDHEMLARKMTPFVKQAGLTPSNSLNGKHQDLYDKLKVLSGAEFDKEYVTAMDKDHHEDLSDFRAEIGSTKDVPLKAAVESGEKVIAEHTQIIDQLSRRMGMTPAGA